MKQNFFSNPLLMVVLASLVAPWAFGQIGQEHPEMCGSPGAIIPVPSGIVAVSDRSQGTTEFSLKGGGTPVMVQLSAISIEQVCSVSQNKLLVAGETSGAPIIYLISTTGQILDSFYGWDPVMSPDQHWLIMRKFYPLHMEVPYTEEYLLYDLTKNKTANRPPGVSADETADVGRTVYPVGLSNNDMDNINVPKERVHRFYSDSFYWASDSQAVVFGDNLQGKLSIMLVTIDGDIIKTFVHSVASSEACRVPGMADRSSYAITVSHPEIGANQSGDRQLRAPLRFDVSALLCKGGGDLILHSEDFQPASVENFPQPQLTPAATGPKE
jgi:hypothetical protein